MRDFLQRWALSLGRTNVGSCPGHRHSHRWLRTSEQGGSRWLLCSAHSPRSAHSALSLCTNATSPHCTHSHVVGSLAAAPGGLPHARPQLYTAPLQLSSAPPDPRHSHTSIPPTKGRVNNLVKSGQADQNYL